jgi:hypothetical protein
VLPNDPDTTRRIDACHVISTVAIKVDDVELAPQLVGERSKGGQPCGVCERPLSVVQKDAVTK